MLIAYRTVWCSGCENEFMVALSFCHNNINNNKQNDIVARKKTRWHLQLEIQVFRTKIASPAYLKVCPTVLLLRLIMLPRWVTLSVFIFTCKQITLEMSSSKWELLVYLFHTYALHLEIGYPARICKVAPNCTLMAITSLSLCVSVLP